MKQLSLSVIIILVSFINTTAQNIYTFAGIGNTIGGLVIDSGLATLAHFYYPSGIATDHSGNVYIADRENSVRVVNTNGIITTFAGNGIQGYAGDGGPASLAQLNDPSAIAFDANSNLYIVDQGNNRIRRVDKITGVITTFAGNGAQGYTGDGGAAVDAELYWPNGIAIDKATGNVYISDTWNNVIRMVNTAGIITTVAGTADSLSHPYGITIDATGDLLIADSYNYVVKKVNASGIMSIFAGNRIQGYGGDGGAAVAASFYLPLDVKTDTSGNVFVADGTGRVRMINAAGIVTDFAGSSFSGYGGDGDPAVLAGIGSAISLAIDSAHNVYIGDAVNNNVRRVGAAVTGISIRSNTGDTACYNTLSSFTATAIADSFVPHYQWTKNGSYVGTDNAVFTPVSYTTGDLIDCILYNSTGDTLAWSMPITIDSLVETGAIGTPSVFCVGSSADIYGYEAFSTDFAYLSFQWVSSDTNVLRLNNYDDDFLSQEYASALSVGTATLYFITTNICGTDSTYKIITVEPDNLGPILGPDTLCAGISTTYTDTTTGGFWSTLYTGPGMFINDSTGNFYSFPDFYATSLVIAYGTLGCNTIDTVFVEPDPIIQLITGPEHVDEYGTIALSDFTAGGTWSSSNNSIATIDAVTGTVYGVSVGQDTIYYTLTNANGCTFSREYVINVLPFTAVPVVNENNSFSVFPNPASGSVHISWTDQQFVKGTVDITDVTGQTVLSIAIDAQNTNNANVDIVALKPGVYMLTMQTGNFYLHRKLEIMQ